MPKCIQTVGGAVVTVGPCRGTFGTTVNPPLHTLHVLFIGTGTNACYVEKLENVELWDGDDQPPKQVRCFVPVSSVVYSCRLLALLA